MKARYPIRAKTPATVAYQYYNPEVRAVSAPVEIIFDLEERRDLSLIGKITRVESGSGASGLGVQFTDVFSLSHKVVQDYLRTNLH